MRSPARLLGLAATLAVVAVNAIAFMQARAMTHFSPGGRRTERPERLAGLEAVHVMVAGVTIPRPENGTTPRDVGLAFETHRFPSAHGPTLEAWYVPGSAPGTVIVLLHGYAASKATMLPLARRLHDLGQATLLLDFYGSGGSSGSGTTLGVVEARDVRATVDFASARWPDRQVVLYGTSMGGAAALRAIAIEGVTPAAVIVENTFTRLLDTTKRRFALLGVPPTPFAELLLFWGGVQEGFDPFTHDPVAYARAVRCPALVLQGAADARVSVDDARRLADAMGDAARLVTYPGVAHALVAESRPLEWARDVGPFLASLPAARP